MKIKKVFLNSICRPKQWKTISTSQLLESGYPVYGANGKIGFFDKFTHSEPTLLVTCRGATCGTINICEPNSYVNGNAMALDGLSEEVDIIYLKHYLEYRKFGDVISGSAQPQITFAGISKIQIPLPPLEEQKRIAAILDAADLHRQKTKELIAKYDELAQALFLDMFGGPVSNPKGWAKIEIQNITSVSSGSTPSRELPENYIGDIPWVKTGEVNGKEIIDSEEKISQKALENSSCKVYPKGSILIAMYGQGKTRGQVGYLGIPASTNQACAVLKYSEKMNFVFLYNLLKLCYEDLRSLGRGGNQPNLNSGLIKKYLVINPPIEVQEAFSKHIKIIEFQKSQTEQSLHKAEELFQSLLQKAFKGEL